MNPEAIDSSIYYGRYFNGLFVGNRMILTAPKQFDDGFDIDDAWKEIERLRSYLYLSDVVDCHTVYMDDLDDFIIEPLLHQITYETIKNMPDEEAYEEIVSCLSYGVICDEIWTEDINGFFEYMQEKVKTDPEYHGYFDRLQSYSKEKMMEDERFLDVKWDD